MKTFKKIVLLFSVLCSTMIHATIIDSTLYVPHTDYAEPVIDGKLDSVWYNVSNIHMSKFVDNIQPENWLDFYSTFRFMYGDTALYFFVHVMDDTIQTDAVNSSENDGVEIYIDSNNIKADVYIEDNDCHWIWAYSDTAGSLCSGNEQVAWFKTEYGYNFELAIPADDLFFNLYTDHVMGFDIQCNDRDNHSRENIAKWWSSSNVSWLNPSLFGVAELGLHEVISELNITWMNAPQPEIDGDLDQIWEVQSERPFNQYLAGTDLSEMNDWDDIKMDFRIAFDENTIYLFVRVIDDLIDTTASDPSENDGVELYFDAQNQKNLGSYIPGNDVHWRWVYGETKGNPGPDNAVCAWKETEIGYCFELAIPATDLPRKYGFGPKIGFEIQVNDNDIGYRESALRWWSESENSSYDPSLFGTAVFWDPCLRPWIWGPDTTPVNETALTVNQYILLQNYPNPFNPITEISYSLDKPAHVKLVVFDVTGREITTLIDNSQSSGEHKVIFDGSDFPSGVYFYKFEIDQHVTVKKMTLIK